jgi:hypothetical protein
VLFACSAAAAAAAIERGLPPSTTAVLTIDIKQLLHAPAVKQHGLAPLRQALQNTDSIRAALTALGLDPLGDLDRLTIALVKEGKKDESLLILRGRFDTARFHLAAKHLAKEYGDRIAAHKTDGLKYYSVVASDKHGSLTVATALVGANKDALLNVEKMGSLLDPIGGFCVTLADKNTLIAASSEELLKGTCKRIAGKDSVSLNKPMRHLLTEMDGKQTIVFALRSSCSAAGMTLPSSRYLEHPPQYIPPSPPFPLPRELASQEAAAAADSGEAQETDAFKLPPPLFEKLETPPRVPPLPPPPPLPEPSSSEARQSPPRELSGSITLADDFKLRCALRTASNRDAKEMMKDFDDLRLRMGGLAILLAGSNKHYAFLKEIPNSFLAVRKGRIILVEGHLSAETLAKLFGVKINVKSR